MYQFHYYGFRFNAKGEPIGTLDMEEHQKYLLNGIKNPDGSGWSGKVRFSQQSNDQVPVLIGEFNGFGDKAIWELLVSTFKDQGWR